MNKGQLSNALRKIGLLTPLDLLRFKLQRRRNKKINQHFTVENPKVALPADYLIYESFQMNYAKYYFGGKEAAAWVLSHIRKHKNLEGKRILDWGCGPGRLIRHVPELLQYKSHVYATDYNEASIAWCKEHIANVAFNQNKLAAKLPYEDHFFDAIYGISIFTHLSEEMHFNWLEELKRILKPGGILFITTQGNNFKKKLSVSERNSFEKGELIVRGNVKEGHRTFSAFHPDKFMRSLFENSFQVIDKIVISPKDKSYTPQDAWILKKTQITVTTHE